jgi:hypothetical protein
MACAASVVMSNIYVEHDHSEIYNVMKRDYSDAQQEGKEKKPIESITSSNFALWQPQEWSGAMWPPTYGMCWRM